MPKTTTTKSSLAHRLKQVGLDPKTVTKADYPKVLDRLGWAESTFRTFLAYHGKDCTGLREGFRDYTPTDDEYHAVTSMPFGFGITLAYLGCRFSEMWTLRLDPSSLYVEETLDDYLLIDTAKGGEKVRIHVPTMPPPVQVALRYWLDSMATVTPSKIRREWKRLRDTGSISKSCIPHSFRHRLVTNLIQEGMSIEQVAKTVGHRNPKTTFRYLHQNPQAQSASRNKVHLDDRLTTSQLQGPSPY